jgi:DnaJ-domain-containing protein 1
MGIRLLEAKTAGKTIGYKQAIVEIQDKVTEEKAKTFPSSPYAVLDLEASAPLAALEERYKYLLSVYDPRNFSTLDKAFVELAEIRTQQVKRAWAQINLGIKPADASKGMY